MFTLWRDDVAVCVCYFFVYFFSTVNCAWTLTWNSSRKYTRGAILAFSPSPPVFFRTVRLTEEDVFQVSSYIVSSLVACFLRLVHSFSLGSRKRERACHLLLWYLTLESHYWIEDGHMRSHQNEREETFADRESIACDSVECCSLLFSCISQEHKNKRRRRRRKDTLKFLWYVAVYL